CLQIKPTSGLIQLRDASCTNSTLQQSYEFDVQAGQTYHLKVNASGSQFSVYWDKQYRPVMLVTDTTYLSGYLGL
ncbi:hypothetical protein QCD85_23770, partial [Paenibacillus sp. PsM32]|uniref:hypothetical protein n=1 Tax=Paenibacillus sp. PsM32 TaxID=3030536 RepID=UPI00263A8E20